MRAHKKHGSKCVAWGIVSGFVAPPGWRVGGQMLLLVRFSKLVFEHKAQLVGSLHG
jgi:hypothetical protein